MRRVTIRDVAQRAGVSSSTVSRVLNGSASISQRTRQAVREACQALHYVPDITARGLSGHKTHTIGIIVPDISNPYFSALCTAAEAGASARGYRAILCNTLYEPVNELDAIGRMLSQRVDGLLVAAHSPHTQAQHAALLGELPCVYLGSNHGPGCSYVEVDNEQGAYQATQYLYRLGHRRIVFLGGRQDSRTLEQRLQGYRRSMLANHLIPDAAAAPDGTENLGAWCFQEARRLFRQSPCPDAVIAYSDILAMQVMEAAEECGLHAPEDFSVIGFDDIALGRLPHIHLTTVSQRETQAGELAIRRLLEKIDGSAAVTEDILEPELVIRSTCRRI